jgi:hypothetical protein
MSGVVLGNDNITIGGKILETFKSVGDIGLESDFPTFDNDTFVEPVIHFFPDVLPYVAPINIPGTDFAYVSLVNTGATQTSYTMNFQENTECDILIVGGGGAGGTGIYNTSHEPGGGGAGGVVYMVNKIFNTGTYIINVGRGGTSNNNGNNSSITTNTNTNIIIDGINLIGQGGGSGASSGEGQNGGSGGGGCFNRTNGGTSTQGNTFWNGTIYIQGGHAGEKPINSSRGGGGGGSAEIGGTDGEGSGGDGRSVSITGTSTFYAGGGGGVIPGGSGSYSRSDGGGGIPNPSENGGTPTAGIPNTGSGGGGAYTKSVPPLPVGASGGSGIVIIRFRTTRVIPILMLASDPIPASIISTIDSNYKYAFFANTGGNPTVYNIDFKQPTECDVLIIGGGGGGGMDMGGGGGAGGFIKLNNQYFNGLYTINVGKGGDGAPAAGTNGQPAAQQFTINAKNGGNSQFGNNIAIGGGYGGSSVFTHQLAGQGSSGGSGGGSSGYLANNNINKAGVGTIGQGNRGGFGLQAYHSGGGGGAGSIGGGAPSIDAGAAFGGFGIYSDITGEGYYWAGGGGGAGYTTTGGNGGLGGGGGGAVGITFGGIGYNNGDPGGGGSTGAQTNRPGGNGGQHTGGGGGGGSHYNSNNKGGDGGSGVVIIRYRYNKKLLSIRIDTDYNYFALYNANENQTQYNITFPKQTECDILVVGGGGSGGRFGGGGGAGSVLFKSQIVIVGNCTINVGRGGIGHNIFSQIGGNGQQSTITINGVNYIADGGGGGGSRQESQSAGPQNGASGGSGGGGSHSNTGTGAIGGVTTKTSYTYSGWETNGFNGGNGRPNTSGGNPNHASGGGGGAGGLGQNWDSTGGGNGGLAKEYISVFGSGVGHNGYFGGGGGGNTYASEGDVGFANGGNGLFGGGGNGGFDGGTELPGADALGGTGGGGGGSKYDGGTAEDTDGGDGGSGIVIIRYKVIKTNFDAQWTYNSTNPSVYHIGNVGIGTTNPRSALSIVGSVSITGEYLARTKTFKIEHPLNMNKWLYHGCVEAPRFDNMYRGKKRITNGKCEVDIDKECNDTGGMTDGTFDALNADTQLYLQNTNTFDAVKGSIKDGKIIIICENTIDDIDVDWLVIGERQDENIIGNRLTNNMGNLICEHNVD